MALTLISNRFL